MRSPKPPAVPDPVVVDARCLVVVVDARCLQDPSFAPRGIGRHARAVMAGFQQQGRGRLVALTDPALPPMDPHLAELFDITATNPYAAQREAEALGRLTAYVATSPMTHDPLFGARFLTNPALDRIAAVYDFIPLRHPTRYLATPAADLDYAVALFWLSKCDRFVPISQSAADDLVHHLHVPRAAIAVSGSVLADPHATDRSASPFKGRTAILTVGGGDPRKSPETVVAAHARSTALQQAATPLTVAGNYSPAERDAFKTLAAAEGGDPDLVRVPGEVDDAELVALYRSARIVVCASTDEGFSIPVVEGMAAGALVLASDIPAHRELLPSADHLFPVGNAAGLATLMEEAGRDRRAATATLKAQDQVWPRFRSHHVAERFWAHAFAAPLPAPAIRRGARPLIAILSPMPPDQSGVADYTHATCRELGKHADLHVFTNTHDPAPVPGTACVLPLTDLPGLSPRYDRTVAVIGNSQFHVSILDHLERYGGASIAHDARMLGFYCGCRGNHDALTLASRELGRLVSQRELDGWNADEGTLPITFLSGVAAASTPMMVHSPVTQAILRDQLGIAAAYLPFSIYQPFDAEAATPATRRAARARLGIQPGDLALASFGFVDRSKAPEDCIWAVEQLRRWGVPATLHFVGKNTPDHTHAAALSALAARLGVADHVHFFPGFLGQDTFHDFLLAADVAIQLRTYGLGGLSGALLDCAAAGLPCVANQGLFDAVAPPPAFTAAIPDSLSVVLLAEQVMALAGRRGTKPTEAARREFCRDRSLARYAGHLMTALDLGA